MPTSATNMVPRKNANVTLESMPTSKTRPHSNPRNTPDHKSFGELLYSRGINMRAKATHQPSNMSVIIAPLLVRKKGVKHIAAAASNRVPGWIPARMHVTYVVSARTQIKNVKLTKARPTPLSVPPALPQGKLTTSIIGPLCVADKHSFKRDKLKS